MIAVLRYPIIALALVEGLLERGVTSLSKIGVPHSDRSGARAMGPS
jgi:hypothetical protein